MIGKWFSDEELSAIWGYMFILHCGGAVIRWRV
jgi:hypothetical protein